MDNHSKPQAGGGDPATPEDPSFDAPTFEAHDARLDRELRRFDRIRAGSKGAEFGHDETYVPGYHQGGTRFGFFNLRSPAKPDPKKS
jgi:hypothetical protein